MNYNFANVSTEKLEAMDIECTLSIRAMSAWSNRNLAKAKRASVVESIREKQNAIVAELMKREGQGA